MHGVCDILTPLKSEKGNGFVCYNTILPTNFGQTEAIVMAKSMKAWPNTAHGSSPRCGPSFIVWIALQNHHCHHVPWTTSRISRDQIQTNDCFLRRNLAHEPRGHKPLLTRTDWPFEQAKISPLQERNRGLEGNLHIALR